MANTVNSYVITIFGQNFNINFDLDGWCWWMYLMNTLASLCKRSNIGSRYFPNLHFRIGSGLQARIDGTRQKKFYVANKIRLRDH